MKVELTKDFELVVTPETAVESIALKAWSDKYFVISDAVGPKESPAATLLIHSFGAGEDRLYRTALAMINYHNEYGPHDFKMYFGSLAILKECEQIIAEGEGNPHPWPGKDSHGATA